MATNAKGVKKTKKENTSAEQKAQEAEVNRQRALVRDVIYPLVMRNSKSIEDAKTYLQTVATALESAYAKEMQVKQMELSLSPTKNLDVSNVITKDTKYDRERELLAIFADEKLGTTDALLMGLKQAIEGFQREEAAGRDLATLKATFL